MSTLPPRKSAPCTSTRTGNPLDLDAIRVLQDSSDPMYEVVMEMVCAMEDDPAIT